MQNVKSYSGRLLDSVAARYYRLGSSIDAAPYSARRYMHSRRLHCRHHMLWNALRRAGPETNSERLVARFFLVFLFIKHFLLNRKKMLAPPPSTNHHQQTFIAELDTCIPRHLSFASHLFSLQFFFISSSSLLPPPSSGALLVEIFCCC